MIERLQGRTIQVLTDGEDPGKSTNTDLVFAWYTLGGKLHDVPFQKVEENGKLRVSWVLDITEEVDIAGEQVSYDTFKKRWEDIDWCKANEWNPISIIRAYRDNSRDAKRWARAQATGLMKRKGNSVCVVYPDSPDWLKKEFARFL
jgi:hypothetical protein